MRYIRFVVLTSSRTGSSWLIDVLNKHAGVEAHGELFLGHRRLSPALAGRSDYRRFIEVHGTPGFARTPRVFSYLNDLYRAPCTVGFKLMYTQLRQHPEILAYIALRHVRIVQLTRQNLIDIPVSEELGKLTGVSHIQAGTNSSLPMVRLDPVTVVNYLRIRRKRPQQLRLLMRFIACPILEVSYEALVEGEHELRRILDFIEVPVPAAQIQSSLVKRGTRSHREAIINYDEIRRTLQSTPFLSMLR